MIITLLVILLATPSSLASYCGSNGVPYSLEILSDGTPVLGCAQPTCIADPSADYEDSQFLTNRVGQDDGFFREGDRQRKTYSHSKKHKAECPGEFSDLACTSKNQWVGGIAFDDNSEDPLTLQCCTFEGLRFSQDVGVTTISTGEAVTGGEVIRDGRQISFDVIANVRRLIDPDDQEKTFFEVTVRRMNCLPDPPEFEVSYDEDVGPEIIRVLSNAVNSKIELGQTKKEERSPHKRPYKRKPKTSSTRSVVTHEGAGKKKVHEPFFGSFGAPIYNPTGDVEQEETEVFETSTIPTTTSPTTTRPPVVYTRRIVTLKPRFRTTTTTAAPKVNVLVEQATIPPSPAQVNPFSFAPLPAFPALFPFQPQPQFTLPPPPPAPILPTHQTFGQPPGLQPLPHHPAPFGLFHHQPPAPPTYGLQQNLQPFPTYGIRPVEANELNNLDSYTRSLLTEPDSPFAIKSQFQFGVPFHPQQAQFAGYSNNVQPPAPQSFDLKMAAPQRVQQIPGIEDSDLVQPVIAPRQQQLGSLYRAPPFAALGTTIYNFQSTPRKHR